MFMMVNSQKWPIPNINTGSVSIEIVELLVKDQKFYVQSQNTIILSPSDSIN